MLLSAGGFAVYRYESHVFNVLVPRFGGLRTVHDREKLLHLWLNSEAFRRSGLNAEQIASRIKSDCRSGGDFLRIYMEEIARQQGAARWADCTPEHLLYTEQIKREIPQALFIHIIRDGRDVALSYLKQHWVHALPWDRGDQMGVAGLYWRWIVGNGREAGKRLGADYHEVQFEELIERPEDTLSRIGTFIAQDLDYEKIQRAGIGSVREPNTSFETEGAGFHPVGRWKTLLSAEKTAGLESLIGDRLKEIGYPLVTRPESSLRSIRLRASYRALFEAKQWTKNHTPLGRTVSLDNLQVEDPAS